MSQKSFTLQIVTVGSALFDGEALELHCRGAGGQMTILAHHEPLITKIEKGVVRVITKQKEETFEIEGGVLEVADNKAVMLCSRSAE